VERAARPAVGVDRTRRRRTSRRQVREPPSVARNWDAKRQPLSCDLSGPMLSQSTLLRFGLLSSLLIERRTCLPILLRSPMRRTLRRGGIPFLSTGNRPWPSEP
jgi:hypothetical protein